MEYTASRVAKPVTTYHEVQGDKVLYRITSVFKGEIDLKTALEDMTVRRVAQESLSASNKA